MSMIADNIKTLMDRKGVSAYQIQKDTDNVIKQSTLSRILNGENEPRRLTIKRLADYFDVTVAQLLGEEPLPEGDRIKYPAGPLPSGANPKLWAEVPAKIDSVHQEKLAEFAGTFVEEATLNDPFDQHTLKLIFYAYLERRQLDAVNKKSVPIKTP